jgi:hypothetical protein
VNTIAYLKTELDRGQVPPPFPHLCVSLSISSRQRRPRQRPRGVTHSPSSSSRYGPGSLRPPPKPYTASWVRFLFPRDAPEQEAFPRPRLSCGSGPAFRSSRGWRWASSRVRVRWVRGWVLGRRNGWFLNRLFPTWWKKGKAFLDVVVCGLWTHELILFSPAVAAVYWLRETRFLID